MTDSLAWLLCQELGIYILIQKPSCIKLVGCCNGPSCNQINVSEYKVIKFKCMVLHQLKMRQNIQFLIYYISSWRVGFMHYFYIVFFLLLFHAGLTPFSLGSSQNRCRILFKEQGFCYWAFLTMPYLKQASIL